MIITTSAQIEGKTIAKTVGLVKGSTIRARHLGRDIMAGLRSMVGGEVTEYTKMMAEARNKLSRGWLKMPRSRELMRWWV